jgi:hypothetical protein
MADVFCGAVSSPLKLAMAMGTCVKPTPETSTLNWAHAALGAKTQLNKKALKCALKGEK